MNRRRWDARPAARAGRITIVRPGFGQPNAAVIDVAAVARSSAVGCHPGQRPAGPWLVAARRFGRCRVTFVDGTHRTYRVPAEAVTAAMRVAAVRAYQARVAV